MTKVDQMVNIKCFYMEAEKPVTAPMEVRFKELSKFHSKIDISLQAKLPLNFGKKSIKCPVVNIPFERIMPMGQLFNTQFWVLFPKINWQKHYFV